MSLFDEYGRRIPPPMKAPAHQASRRYYKIDQPAVDLAAVHGRLARHLGVKMPLGEFAGRVEWIEDHIAGMGNDGEAGDAVFGVSVPFALPRGSTDSIGAAMDQVFLPAVGDAFKEACPKYEFTNHAREGMSGKVGIAPGSRHEKLLAAMAVGEVVGVYLPCVLEYSVPAALEQMAELPEDFLLSGGFDTAAAFVAAPVLLLRKDGYPPLLWLSALADEKVGYHFEAYGANLTFNRRPHLGRMSEYWSSGLTVIG